MAPQNSHRFINQVLCYLVYVSRCSELIWDNGSQYICILKTDNFPAAHQKVGGGEGWKFMVSNTPAWCRPLTQILSRPTFTNGAAFKSKKVNKVFNLHFHCVYWMRISLFHVTYFPLDNFCILTTYSLAIFTWNTALNAVFTTSTSECIARLHTRTFDYF